MNPINGKPLAFSGYWDDGQYVHSSTVGSVDDENIDVAIAVASVLEGIQKGTAEIAAMLFEQIVCPERGDCTICSGDEREIEVKLINDVSESCERLETFYEQRRNKKAKR